MRGENLAREVLWKFWKKILVGSARLWETVRVRIHGARRILRRSAKRVGENNKLVKCPDGGVLVTKISEEKIRKKKIIRADIHEATTSRIGSYGEDRESERRECVIFLSGKVPDCANNTSVLRRDCEWERVRVVPRRHCSRAVSGSEQQQQQQSH